MFQNIFPLKCGCKVATQNQGKNLQTCFKRSKNMRLQFSTPILKMAVNDKFEKWTKIGQQSGTPGKEKRKNPFTSIN